MAGAELSALAALSLSHRLWSGIRIWKSVCQLSQETADPALADTAALQRADNGLSFKNIPGHLTPKPTVGGDFALDSLTTGPGISGSDALKPSSPPPGSAGCVNAVPALLW